MEETLTSLATYGYIFLFFYSFGGGFVALAAAGVLASTGKMELYIAIPLAMTSNFLGDTLLFYFSKYNKRDMMKYFRKHRRKLALSHILMKKHGPKIIVIQKFIYGLKTLIPIAIGFTKYPTLKFTIINFFASILWALVVGLGSYYAGSFFMNLFNFAKENPLIMPIIAIGIISLAWFYMERITSKKIAKA